MISDNYVTGDNIYLRELQNFFFEVLGMMSVTHYGAIGDGRTDNYGPLQVAIDDANRRGLSYIYVPYGRFIYTGELINMDKVEFVGNPHAHILNIRTGVEIPIKQFGLDTTSKFYTKDEVNELLATGLATKQDTLIAGEGITMDGNIISAVTGDGQLFTHSIYPTWVGSVEQQTDTGTNTYGEWTISTDATPQPDTGTKISRAFDGDADTAFSFRCSSDTQSSGTPVELEIDLPTGVKVNPLQIYLKERGIYDRADKQDKLTSLVGYNPISEEWETIWNMPTRGSGTDTREFTIELATSHYYTKYKLTNIYRYGSTGGGANVYEFDIPIGKVKTL